MCNGQVQPDLLSIKQASQIVGLSEKTVRRFIESGELPAHRVGPKAVRIYRSDLDAFIQPLPRGGQNIGVIFV